MKNHFLGPIGIICILLLPLSGCDSGLGNKSFSERLDADSGALKKEICTSLMATRKFDTGARREILKDYGAPLSVIASIEKYVDSLSTMSGCLFTLGFQSSF